MKIKAVLKSKLFITLLLIIIYLILAKDGYHQWDEACYLSEAAYKEETGFHCFPFDHFRLHIFFLTFLVSIFGTGFFGLFVVDFIYTLLMLGFFYVCFLIFREILGKKNDAFNSLVILMFLPLSLYFGYKTMTEVPAMLLGSISLLFFIRGYKSKDKKKLIFYYVLSGISLYLSSISRFDGPMLFFSFTGALFIISLGKQFKIFKAKKVFIAGVLISLVFLSSFLFVFLTFSFNGYERFISSKKIYNILNIEYNENELSSTYEIYRSKEEASKESIGKNLQLIIYNFFRRVLLGGSLFYVFFLISFANFKKREFWFIILWYFLSLIPIAWATQFAETRYLYISSAPLAILVWFGLKNILSLIKNTITRNILHILIFFLIVIINLSFIYYIEFGISEKDYDNLIRQIDRDYDDYTILTPNNWADYSFLKFRYPNKKIISVQTLEDGTKTYNKSEEVKNINQLRRINTTKVFICHQRTREVKMLEKIFTKLPLNIKPTSKGICIKSWIWNSKEVLLQKRYQSGTYTAYTVEEK